MLQERTVVAVHIPFGGVYFAQPFWRSANIQRWGGWASPSFLECPTVLLQFDAMVFIVFYPALRGRTSLEYCTVLTTSCDAALLRCVLLGLIFGHLLLCCAAVFYSIVLLLQSWLPREPNFVAKKAWFCQHYTIFPSYYLCRVTFAYIPSSYSWQFLLSTSSFY